MFFCLTFWKLNFFAKNVTTMILFDYLFIVICYFKLHVIKTKVWTHVSSFLYALEELFVLNHYFRRKKEVVYFCAYMSTRGGGSKATPPPKIFAEKIFIAAHVKILRKITNIEGKIGTFFNIFEIFMTPLPYFFFKKWTPSHNFWPCSCML
jgi:hypothetical protein